MYWSTLKVNMMNICIFFCELFYVNMSYPFDPTGLFFEISLVYLHPPPQPQSLEPHAFARESFTNLTNLIS